MRALISIGTNSTRLLVVDGEEQVRHEVRGTRIGEGLHERGPIDPAAAQRTLDAVTELAQIARDCGASIAGIATSALRRAADAEAFRAAFAERTGTQLQIVSGEEEAGYSFIGAVRGLRLTGELGVLDVGGGSSEYAFGDEHGAQALVSCEIGAVRLTEQVPELSGQQGAAARDAIERARAVAQAALEPICSKPRPQRLVTVGGTGFAAGSMIAQSNDREGLSGTTLTSGDLEALLIRLAGLDLGQRRALPFMTVQRADILPGGIIVVLSAMTLLGRDAITLSSSDLLYGYLVSNASDGQP